jgi:hypothetical protein
MYNFLQLFHNLACSRQNDSEGVASVGCALIYARPVLKSLTGSVLLLSTPLGPWLAPTRLKILKLDCVKIKARPTKEFYYNISPHSDSNIWLEWRLRPVHINTHIAYVP